MIAVATSAWSSTLARAVSRAVVASGNSFDLPSGTSTTAAFTSLAQAVLRVAEGRVLESLTAEPWMHRATLFTRCMRRAILAERTDGFTSDTDALRLLDALEHVETVCSKDASSQLSEQLGGNNAMDLLVEVAHDLRSPIGSLLLLVDRIRKGHSGPVTSAQERQLGLVYAAAFGLSTLTSDLMELARGGARLVGKRPVSFSVGEVMRLVCELVQPIAEEKGLDLRVVAPDDDVRVGHPAALYRVLLNLATNALKFTNEGRVVVAAESLSVDVVRFSVRDTGRGIPAHQLQDLYEIFRRRERPGDYAFSSAGLGLAICQKLVGAMGGELQVSSSESGSQFSFDLELARPATH